jgi:hypothetical protein
VEIPNSGENLDPKRAPGYLCKSLKKAGKGTLVLDISVSILTISEEILSLGPRNADVKTGAI